LFCLITYVPALPNSTVLYSTDVPISLNDTSSFTFTEEPDFLAETNIDNVALSVVVLNVIEPFESSFTALLYVFPLYVASLSFNEPPIVK